MRSIGWALAACIGILASAAAPVSAAELTASQIIEKNAVARGGVDAWRKIQTMAWAGHVESANAPGREMSFLLEQKRPNKTRFELTTDQQKSMRIFDGANGWKMRPASNGKPELQPYTAEELKFAQDAQVIDGPLMGYAATGVNITLGGVDEVEGRKAYRLNLRQRSGANSRVWIDAETFLEIRFDRESRGAQGQSGVVSIVFRDYHAFEGLQLPVIIETGAGNGKAADKLVIEKVALNPELEDRMFAKPNVPASRSRGVTVDTRVPPPAPRTAQPAQK